MYKIGLFLLHRLPSPLSYKLAAFVSDLQYFFLFRDRRAVAKNLANIVPSADNISFLTRDVFRNFGRYLIEFFQMKEMVDEQFIKNNVRIEGMDHLDKVLAQGNGGIIVTAHIGNWELGAVLLSVLGYSVMAIALPHKERPVNDLFNDQREAKGVTVVPSDGALRHCIEQLRSNKLVALAADRDFSNNGIVMDFLGSKMLVPKGPAMFSLKTGAPILPMFLIRNGDGTFTFSCSAPIYPPERNGGEDDEMMKGVMKRYMSVIKDKILAYPSQWLLFREFSLK
ncbi:MAG: lysophospholipid acyltransferase family protein [Candidatus Omnitrophica bacterium]|nr:lysophospholipid acyltransferase family protein [Candidatus Omnitrophota bacterium]